jgi:RecJ-like exonuclease
MSGDEEEDEPMAPGDEAPEDDDWVGVIVCTQCGGSGVVDGDDCPTCDGTGQLTKGVGDG